MRTNTIVYWITTGLLAAQMAFAGLLYFTSPEVGAGFDHLGFPDYFRVELGVAKLVAAVLLILPIVPLAVKEWAYTGLAITFVSAFIAHTAVDGMSTAIAPVVSLALLVVSYIFAHRRAPVSALA